MGRNLQNKIVNRRGSTTMISVERELAARRLRNNQKPTTTVGKCPNAKNGKGNPCDCGLSVSNNLNKDKRKRNSDYERNTRRRKRQKKDESQPCLRKDEWPCNCGIDVQNTPNKSLKSDGETSEKMGRKLKKKRAGPHGSSPEREGKKTVYRCNDSNRIYGGNADFIE